MRTGVLLLNLGTPDEPTTEKVKEYLGEFLMDPDVIDIPFVFRWLLVKQIILRVRPKKSAEAYAQIWNERGSPLRYHSLDFKEKLEAEMFEKNHVFELGMRYGKPSIEEACRKLKEKNVDRLVVFPLYPQYAASSVRSCLKLFETVRQKLGWLVETQVIDPFYDKHEFVEAWVQTIEPALKDFKPDHILMSFHGLPERHVKASDLTQDHCLKSPGCCDEINQANKNCYRAQAFATARSFARRLNLAPEEYTVCFQSRLGTTPWIKPYTDLVYAEVVKKGFKKVLVICPAFVADCLETLEEIGIRGRNQFKELGGSELLLVPSLNSAPHWVSGARRLIESVK